MSNKLKIFNDPIYGFISIPGNLVFDVIEHPYFQRLRRIKQLGLTSYVYPGALHTRFHHALGAMHLMGQSIQTLRKKGIDISAEEEEAVVLAILLHDIGHGPFSHALESSIVQQVAHEEISLMLMDELNTFFSGKLSLAIRIFKNDYPRKFLHQLVSSQLDMDRLDYLKRDSFFTGVSEGIISSDRIIYMLKVVDDQLVVESKGIYSIEKFIIARRLMYWQVYLHKTVLCAENMLVSILRRARELANAGETIFGSSALLYFMKNNISKSGFTEDKNTIRQFCILDDDDIFCAVKEWSLHPDFVLSNLSRNLTNRNLHHISILKQSAAPELAKELTHRYSRKYGITEYEASFFISHGSVSNSAYKPDDEHIRILYRNGEITDITEAADQLNISALSRTVEKFYLSYPKELMN